jgi:hypothetical protein
VKWPWVRRSRFEAARCESIAVQKDAERLRVDGMQLRSLGQELATRLAMATEELKGKQMTLANMAVHCRELEKKQRDLDAPPISSDDLEKLLKRHALVSRQLETLVEQLNRALKEQSTRAPGYIETVVEGIVEQFTDRRSEAGMPSPGAAPPVLGQ